MDDPWLFYSLYILSVGISLFFLFWFRKDSKSKQENDDDDSDHQYGTPWNSPEMNAPDLSPGALEHEVSEEWNKSLGELCLDFIRIATSMEVFVDGETRWQGSKGFHEANNSTELRSSILSLLTVISGSLDAGELEAVIQASCNHFLDRKEKGRDNPDANEQISTFVTEIGENSKVIRLLKACTEEVLYPVLARLKFVIAHKFPYAEHQHYDKKVLVRIDTSDQSVKVVHQRWEATFEDEVQFRWEMKLSFDKELCNIQSIDVRIRDIKFSSGASKARKMLFMQIVSPFR